MNLKQKWYALPVWGQAVLSLVVIPLLPIIVAAAAAGGIVAVVLSITMSCIEDALDIIYKDTP